MSAVPQVGLPIWNCVVSTTPAGNTTLGQATLAVLNDLGVVAEHLLVYLNGNGALTYEEDIKNDLVSLTNPLYPTGPRLNFSIDFASVVKDDPIFKVIRPQSPDFSVIRSSYFYVLKYTAVFVVSRNNSYCFDKLS